MSILILIELFSLSFSIHNLSAVRSYVNGEGQWSKNQKDAVFYLREYAYTRDEKDFLVFQQKMKVPLGDRRARIELEKENPNLDIARQGFLDGRNNPEDVDGMIRIFRQFRHLYYIDRAITIWTEADPYLDALLGIGNELHQAIAVQHASDAEILVLLKKLEPINQKITILEDDFSNTLGDGSRWLEGLVLKLLLALTFSVEVTGILITISISRNIERGLKEILTSTQSIIQGNLDTRAEVYSKDEIGELAGHFNTMTGTIREKITELKLAEENIRREKERAEASEKVKHLFLANMSHEIRTPMNAILGFARLLQDSTLNAEQKEYISAILQSGDNLLVILNDILDVSKIEANKLALEQVPFNLRELINAALAMIQPKADAKYLSLKYVQHEETPEILNGDALRLTQILLNLLSNAVKFTESGAVELAVLVKERSDQEVTIRFTVSDTGIGVPAELQTRIFESFEQAAGGTARRFGGTGLGLSIVRNLVELQGGKVWVESEPGKGSVFSVILTFSTMVPQQENVPVVSSFDQPVRPGTRILVTEDNRVNQLLVARVLQKQGFEIDLANNGLEALEKLGTDRYDLVIMDLQMPEMDGYEATSIIRSSPTDYSDIPIMAMTAHTVQGEVEKCMALGMNDFISKPFDPDVLKDKIMRLIG